MAGKTIREWFTPEQACEYVSREIGCEVLELDLEQKIASGELNDYLRFTKNDLNQILTEKAQQVAAESQGMAIEILNINFHDAGFYKITEKRLNEKLEEVYLTEIEHENRVYVLMVECDTQAQRYGYPLHELDRFIKAQTELTPETKEPKELNTNERNSLHALIYALTLKDVEADMQSAIPHDADAKQTDTASKLKGRLDKQGINLTEKTIRNHIKRAHTTAQELKNSQ